MPFLNVEISEEAILSAKLQAAKSRVTLRSWIEQMILGFHAPETPAPLKEDDYGRLPSGRLLSPADAALRRAKKGGRQ